MALVAGIRALRKILAQPALAPYTGAELAPGADSADDAALLEYARRYEGKFGPGTRNTFGGHALDAMLILKPAIERTIKRGFLPGNVAGFRKVLRDEIENRRYQIPSLCLREAHENNAAGLLRRREY